MSRLLPIAASLLFVLGCAALLWWTAPAPEPTLAPGRAQRAPLPSSRLERRAPPPTPGPTAGASARGGPPGVRSHSGARSDAAVGGPHGSNGPDAPTAGDSRAPSAPAEVGPTIDPIDVDALPRDLALSPEELAAVLEPMQPLLLRCFEDVARRNPGDRHVELELRIETDHEGASLSRARIIDSDIVDPMALACFEDTPLDVSPRGPGREASVRLRHPVRFRQ